MPWGKVPTVWGTFYVEWHGQEVQALRFPSDPPGMPLVEDSIPKILARELNEYFCGERARFTVPFLLKGPTFFQKVWEEVLCIPYGEVRTYGELARGVGSWRAARAVGQALASNPLPIVVPCHRVVGRHGLGGYGPGLAWKERLLALEAHYKEKFSPR
ncbi:MAG: methylated-DNA--[protein]-cysteine S-methyltransferase [Candidatus Bipolaricaulaceae bacterium]